MYNKVQDSGKKDAGSGKRNFNIKININNKMTLPDGRHSVYLCIKVNHPHLNKGQKSLCVWRGGGLGWEACNL